MSTGPGIRIADEPGELVAYPPRQVSAMTNISRARTGGGSICCVMCRPSAAQGAAVGACSVHVTVAQSTLRQRGARR